ncbi:MAG: GTP-binding protein [Planctomycetota bacterium]|jgi:G3E family GTPase|nr:GTP-binding protein [Planctomycetota bacterium]
MSSTSRDRVPVTVLTGFLGSGKTTLLQKLLTGDEGPRVAVLINELGEVGLDHLFVRNVAETAVALRNGCICCTIREDLRKGLRDLIDGRSRGNVPPFDRILLETTGLADPVPIAQTLTGDPMLLRQVRLANVVTTVDALFGAEQLDTHEESRKQAAIADRLVVTKTDLAGPERVRRVGEKLTALNPMAMLLESRDGASLWPVLFDIDPFNPETKSEEVRNWLRRLPEIENRGHDYDHDHGHEYGDGHRRAHHGKAITTFSVRTEKPLDWTAFAVWLSALVHRHGKNILRIKGLLNVPGARGPVVLNTVQKYITPPTHLDEWPDDDRSSRIVFIAQNLPAEKIRESFGLFMAVEGGAEA